MTRAKVFWSLAVLAIFGCGLSAQGQDWLWAVRLGGAGTDQGNSLAVDPSGSVFIAGEFEGAWTYGYNYLNSAGGRDILIARAYANGNPHWAKRAGSTDDDSAEAIVLDAEGNIYVTGSFRGSVAFGSTTLTSAGYSDVFVAKLSGAGTWLWAVQAGGADNDIGRGVSVDASGNVYVTGEFSGTAAFGSNSLTSSGSTDIFIAKLNSSGAWLWPRKLGSSGADYGMALCADAAGNSYVTGYFTGTVSVGTVAVLISAGEVDAFVLKISSAGNWVWARRGGGTLSDRSYGIALDADGYCCITGNFRGSAVFGTSTLASAGNDDLFIAKLSSAGAWQWAVRGGGSSNDCGYCLATDAGGKIYAGGAFGGTAAFGSSSVASAGSSDVLIAKLDSGGDWMWAKRAGGSLGDHAYGIGLDALACVYITGQFGETADFGPENLTSAGASDVYIAKLTYRIPRFPLDLQISVSGSDVLLTWDPVTHSIWNDPLTPDYYVVYRSLSDPYGEYIVAGISYGTSYTGSNAANYARAFYKVTAYVDDGEETRSGPGLRSWLDANFKPGMTEAEVEAAILNRCSRVVRDLRLRQ